MKILAKTGFSGYTVASYTVYLFKIFVVKCKKFFFGGCVKQITKIMLEDIRGILVAIVKVVNINIGGLV